ncbi:MAG: DNA primase [Actinobacteria bacterium]|nr:DNA primase [Actinomycetota bacterium]
MAKINDEDIDRLRDTADIVEVISGYTQLKKSGGSTFKGLCTFHSDKTPSMSVDQAKGLFFCFGCGEGGNIYHFVQKMENLDFPDAVEWLARKTGFQLRYEEQRPGERQARGLKQRIVAANEEATKFFHKALMDSPEASGARQYLASRGFDREVAASWELGYAPGRDSLTKHLTGKGFTHEELLKANLSRKSDRDGSLYDAYRQRIIFPTRSHQGDVVGFGARKLLESDDGPKYLNTAETPVFQKSRVMYGLLKAKATLGKGDAAIVVEGYTDVIALHEAGIVQAVATNGVALGESHFELLKKFTHRLVLMFDADTAGKGATERGFDLQHKLGLEVLVAPLPEGSDPADVVKNDGADALRKIVDAASPLMEFKLQQTVAKLSLDTPEAKGRAVREVVEVLGWHPDPVARHEYVFMAARLIGVDSDAIQRTLGERGSRPPSESDRAGGVDTGRDRRFPGNVKVEREALQLLVTRTQQAGPWARQISTADFTAPARRELFDAALGTIEAGASELPVEDASKLSPDAFSLFTELSLGADDHPIDDLEGRLLEVFVRLKVFSLERDIKRRRATLQEVNPVDEAGKHDELFTELVGLEAERRDLLRRLQGAA